MCPYVLSDFQTSLADLSYFELTTITRPGKHTIKTCDGLQRARQAPIWHQETDSENREGPEVIMFQLSNGPYNLRIPAVIIFLSLSVIKNITTVVSLAIYTMHVTDRGRSMVEQGIFYSTPYRATTIR